MTVVGEDAVAELDGFEVVGAQVELAIFVDGTQIGTAGGVASFGSGLPVSRQICTFDGFDTTCAYNATVDTAEHAVVVVASAASAKAVFDAMTAGDTLEVRGSVAVTLAAPGLTSSAFVRVTLDTLDGSIKF